jgi:hypothetical protein
MKRRDIEYCMRDIKHEKICGNDCKLQHHGGLKCWEIRDKDDEISVPKYSAYED